MAIYGVDISHHQTKNAVKEVAAGGKADFVITRATIGSYTVDKNLEQYETDLKNSGLKNSYYCASYAANADEARQEADFLIEALEKYGNKPELPLFFDWEYFSADYIKKQFGIEATPQLVQSITEGFCEQILAKGYETGVYLNKDYWDRFYTDSFFEQHPNYKIWYARPGYSQPDKTCDLWQYASDNGAEYGYTGGNIDKNILYSDYSQNGEIEPMKPLSVDPIRLKIGYASNGDVEKLLVKIQGLGIQAEVKDGYIYTSEVSAGDQCYILTDCNALGVPCVIHTESEAEGENTGESTGQVKDTHEKENGKNSLLSRILKRLLNIFFGRAVDDD